MQHIENRLRGVQANFSVGLPMQFLLRLNNGINY
jgi:hypothetical protein